jgi:hypothetical protein
MHPPPPLPPSSPPPPPPGAPPPATVAATVARNARYSALLSTPARPSPEYPLGGPAALCVSGDKLYVAFRHTREVRVFSINAAALRE